MSNQSQKTATTKRKANGHDSSHPVADQMADSLHSSVDSFHQSASKTEEALREKGQNSSAALADKRRELERSWETSGVKKFAVENPVKTAGIAFSLGMLATMILRKK